MEIETGSKSIFKQSTTITGWTKITTYNEYTLRLVNGITSFSTTQNFPTVYGEVSFTGTVSPSGLVGNTTLTAQMLYHTHDATYTTNASPGASPMATGVTLNNNHDINPPTSSSGMTGGGLSHNHPLSSSVNFYGSPLNMSIKYVDVILASKD